MACCGPTRPFRLIAPLSSLFRARTLHKVCATPFVCAHNDICASRDTSLYENLQHPFAAAISLEACPLTSIFDIDGEAAMKSMNQLIRGVMVSLSALLLFAPTASFVSFSAAAQPPHASMANWSMSPAGMSRPVGRDWPPPTQSADAGTPPVPRGDLRGDIADNARRSSPSRPETAQRR